MQANVLAYFQFLPGPTFIPVISSMFDISLLTDRLAKAVAERRVDRQQSYLVGMALKAHNTLCVFFTLRWILIPTQIKRKCNATNSTYITLRLCIYFNKFRVLFTDYENVSSNVIIIPAKKEIEVFPLSFLTQRKFVNETSETQSVPITQVPLPSLNSKSKPKTHNVELA